MAEAWRVTGQRQEERLGPNARFEVVMQVSVETAAGTTATFAIPIQQYNPQYVRAVIDDWYQHESSISSMTG